MIPITPKIEAYREQVDLNDKDLVDFGERCLICLGDEMEIQKIAYLVVLMDIARRDHRSELYAHQRLEALGLPEAMLAEGRELLSRGENVSR